MNDDTNNQLLHDIAGVDMNVYKTNNQLLKQIATEGVSANGGDADTLQGQAGTYYLNRTNHTGTQAVSTVTGLQSALDSKQDISDKGQANGYAPLDAASKVPIANLPSSSPREVLGFWDAATNTPALADGPGAAEDGQFYIVEVGGTRDLGSGSQVFNEGDDVIFHSSDNAWHQIGRSDAVASVNGKTGVVVVNKADVGLGNADNTSDANKPISTATQTALDLKFTTPTPLIPKVLFGTTLSTNVAGLVGYSQDADPDTVAMRSFTGQIAVATAQDNGDAVNKGQMDAAIATIVNAGGFAGSFGAPTHHSGSTDIFLNSTDAMVHLVDGSTGDTEVHLPDSAPAGKVFVIKRMNTSGHGFDIFAGNGLIEGVESVGMANQYSFRTVIFDGNNWSIIGSNGA